MPHGVSAGVVTQPGSGFFLEGGPGVLMSFVVHGFAPFPCFSVREGKSPTM